MRIEAVSSSAIFANGYFNSSNTLSSVASSRPLPTTSSDTTPGSYGYDLVKLIDNVSFSFDSFDQYDSNSITIQFEKSFIPGDIVIVDFTQDTTLEEDKSEFSFYLRDGDIVPYTYLTNNTITPDDGLNSDAEIHAFAKTNVVMTAGMDPWLYLHAYSPRGVPVTGQVTLTALRLIQS